MKPALAALAPIMVVFVMVFKTCPAFTPIDVCVLVKTVYFNVSEFEELIARLAVPKRDAVIPAAEYCNVGVKNDAVYEADAHEADIDTFDGCAGAHDAETARDAVPNNEPETLPLNDAVIPPAAYCKVGVKYDEV